MSGLRSGLDPEDVNHHETARSEKFNPLDLLCDLGLSPYAIEYYLWLAYETGRLPHELLREMVEEHVRRTHAIMAAIVNPGQPA